MTSRKTGKIVECEVCGKEIYRPPRRLKMHKRYFCSFECRCLGGMTKEAKKKISTAFTGRKLSNEHKKKVKENNAKYWLGKKRSKATIDKIKQTKVGSKLSKEHKQKIKENSWMKGRYGKLHPNYNGGKIRGKHMGGLYRDWRKTIFERDNYICQRCKNKGGTLNAHHISGFADFPELRFELDNGIVLCENCHRDFHKRYDRRNNTKEQLEEFLELPYEEANGFVSF